MAGSQVRASQQLRVTNTIMHGGSYPKGYRVINKSLKATVWISQNPGMTPGTGTVVYPGTSISWQVDGDLFLILGDDTRSTDVGFADIILSYDVGDWQPDPVAIASAAMNRQTVLTSGLGGGLSIAQINGANPIDASLFNSIVILASPSSPATAGTSLQVRQFQTLADAIAVNTPNWRNVWTWYGTATASGGNQELRVQVPLRAPYVRVDVAGSAFWTFGSFLSSQVVTDLRYGTTTQPKNGIVMDMTQINTGNIAVGPGTFAQSYTSVPYSGDVDIYCEVNYGVALGAGVMVGWLALFTQNTIAAANRLVLKEILATGGMGAFGVAFVEPFRISLPADQLIATINNNIGQATTAYRYIITAANTFRGD